MTAFPKRRIEHVVGIGFSDDINEAKQVILQSLKGIEGVLDDPAPDVKVTELASASVNLLVRWWVTPSEKTEEIDTRDTVLAAIKNNLHASGIDLPFPTQTILLHDQTDEFDGDRSHHRFRNV
jgi:small-conductance mechanosensitive channel